MPSFKDEYPKIYELINGKKIIAYNSPFDSEVINRTCQLYQLEAPSCRWECAMRAFQAFKGGSWSRLPGGTHGALDDCLAVLKLLKAMAKDELH